ncbi:MAG: DMT family transporter [Planctomycetota bacterium]
MSPTGLESVPTLAEPAVGDALLGPAAGVAASVFWVVTSVFFTAAGRRIGSTAVNCFRLVLAVLLLGGTHWLLAGSLWPEMLQEQLVLLAISGVVGLTLCDQALFTSFLDIGPRRALLCMTTSPVFALAIGVVFLGERLGLASLVGVAITVGGVAWVIAERKPQTTVGAQAHPEHLKRGIVLAVTAALLQALGAMLSKRGIGHGLIDDPSQHMTAHAASFVRMVFGLLGVIPLALWYVLVHRRQDGHAERKAKRVGTATGGYALAAAGAVVGPFLGMWMSLVAFDRTPLLGVAQALCSLSPVIILPFAALIEKERLSPRAVIGALLAVVGAAGLFFTDQIDSWLAGLFG